MVEKTLKETYDNREKQLAGLSYDDYLKSKRWSRIRSRLKKLTQNKVCRKCKTDKNLHLHHLTYQYINTKNDTKNIMALCDVCHKKVHDISKKKQISVYKATIKFLGIKPIRTEKQTPKQKQIEPKSKLQEASEINNAKLLDRLKSYKKYFDINGKKKISTHKRNNY